MELDEKRLQQAFKETYFLDDETVRRIISAYLADKPWPTDASVEATRNHSYSTIGGQEFAREALRAAFEVDPIHQAAVELAKSWAYTPENIAEIGKFAKRLHFAVKDAGLLDQC